MVLIKSSVRPKLPNSIFELHDFVCIYEIKNNKQDHFFISE
jgi:hypothetical protein